MTGYRQTIVEEFAAQAESFNRSEAANAAATLEGLVTLAAPRPGERWLDAACGPGVVARALAPRVGHVTGVDATPAMIELARREAAANGVANADFALGDVTALAAADGSFDGALSRFALHHIPLPGRVVAELARVVRPGGRVVLADTLADETLEAFSFAQEIERLRDPSHWASLTAGGLRALGTGAGLELEHESAVELELDYGQWLARGSGRENAPLIEAALADRPAGSPGFAVVAANGRRILRLRVGITLWRRPAAARAQ